MATTTDLQRFAFNLRRLRKKAGMTQAELAAKLDWSGPFLSNMECGKRIPRLHTVAKVAAALGVDIHALFLPEKKRETPVD